MYRVICIISKLAPFHSCTSTAKSCIEVLLKCHTLYQWRYWDHSVPAIDWMTHWQLDESHKPLGHHLISWCRDPSSSSSLASYCHSCHMRSLPGAELTTKNAGSVTPLTTGQSSFDRIHSVLSMQKTDYNTVLSTQKTTSSVYTVLYQYGYIIYLVLSSILEGHWSHVRSYVVIIL